MTTKILNACLAMSRSWIPVPPESHFPLQNIPFGIFHTAADPAPRGATAIGDFVVDLRSIYNAGLLNDTGLKSNVFANPTLNEFLGYSKDVWRSTRSKLISLLDENGDPSLRDNEELRKEAIHPRADAVMSLPFEVREYTDFYASREHATNVGIMFRGKENALQPNWLHLPVGYHGRASSVVVSGTNVTRPCGQLQKDAANPQAGSNFGACRLLDYELEMGVVVGGTANPLGTPITMAEAEDRIFGMVLLNDWSARDIQAWEYVPLGPFTAKNFATSISPWVVTLDALEPFRTQSSAGPEQAEPTPLEYLRDPNYGRGFYDVNLEVSLYPDGETPAEASVITTSNCKYLYWNIKQQLVHHSVSGASMRPGDLLGTGTISGPEPGMFGSMLELSWRGAHEIPLANTKKENNKRKFLQDGDTVIMTGFAQGSDYRVGFGEVAGKILPANNPYCAK